MSGLKDAVESRGGKFDSSFRAEANIWEKSGAVRGSVWKVGDAHGEGTELLGGAVTAKGELHGGHIEAAGTAAVGADLKAGTLHATARGTVEKHLIGLEGTLESKKYGNDLLQGQTSVRGTAYIGAEVDGFATIGINKDHVGVGAGIDAFAGAKAGVAIHQSVGVAGERVGAAGGRLEVYNGVGVQANASAGYDRKSGKFKLSAGLGASLGWGVGVHGNVEIDVKGTVQAAKNIYNGTTKAVGNAFDRAGKWFW